MTTDPESLCWFPMRVTYQRELLVKQHLDQLEIENFLPMQVDWANQEKKLVPAIHNLIFVRSTRQQLTELKMTKRELEPLRYMMNNAESGGDIMVVPDKQMENFIRVASVEDDTVMYLDNDSYINKVGRHVRITDGQFKDVEGVIKRIKKNRYVVVQIEGVAAVAITYVPACWLKDIS